MKTPVNTPAKTLSVDRSNPPLYMTRAEAALVSTLGQRGISEACARGNLRNVKVGDRRIIRLEDLEAFLASHLSPVPAPVPAHVPLPVPSASKKRGRPKRGEVPALTPVPALETKQE